MGLDFTLATGAVIYLDPNGRIKATLAEAADVNFPDIPSTKVLGELLLGAAPVTFAANLSSLEYLVGDNLTSFGGGGVPLDKGSSSPSASASLSPSSSASPPPR